MAKVSKIVNSKSGNILSVLVASLLYAGTLVSALSIYPKLAGARANGAHSTRLTDSLQVKLEELMNMGINDSQLVDNSGFGDEPYESGKVQWIVTDVKDGAVSTRLKKIKVFRKNESEKKFGSVVGIRYADF